jgi:hypothetical protein
MNRCKLPCGLLLALGLGLLAAGRIAAQDASKQPDLNPEFAAWYYPGAESPGSSTHAETLHQVLLITPDDVPQVEKYYRKLSLHPLADLLDNRKDPPPFGLHTTLGYPHPKDPKKQITAMWGDDSKTKTDGAARGLTLRTLVYDTSDQLVTVTISRTPTDKTTHVLVVYMKKK